MSINSYTSLSTLTAFTLSHLIMATAISAENVDPVKMVDSFEAAGGKFEGGTYEQEAAAGAGFLRRLAVNSPRLRKCNRPGEGPCERGPS